jgi:hypothetical protein
MSNWWKKIRAIVTQGMLATVASQCGGDDGKIFTPGGSDATVNISITDAPVDFASQVSVEFTGIELTPDSGDEVTIDLSPTRVVNLLSLSDGATTALATNQTIDAGTYTSIRFIVNVPSSGTTSSFVDESDGNRYPLVMDGDDDDGLTINKSFTVDSDGRLDIVADFDLRKSISRRTGGSYAFSPVVRVVDSTKAGTISGNIDASLANDTTCTPFVYAYSGSDTALDDMDPDSAGDPVISVPVKLNVSSNTYSYRASYLEAGNYTVAYTCDGSSDDPDTDDSLVFLQSQNANVTANQTQTVNFTN